MKNFNSQIKDASAFLIVTQKLNTDGEFKYLYVCSLSFQREESKTCLSYEMETQPGNATIFTDKEEASVVLKILVSDEEFIEEHRARIVKLSFKVVAP